MAEMYRTFVVDDNMVEMLVVVFLSSCLILPTAKCPSNERSLNEPFALRRTFVLGVDFERVHHNDNFLQDDENEKFY